MNDFQRGHKEARFTMIIFADAESDAGLNAIFLRRMAENQMKDMVRYDV